MANRRDYRTYYEVLHVSRDAPREIIRGSYRTLMQPLKHHPDLGGDTATAALLKQKRAAGPAAARYPAFLAISRWICFKPRLTPPQISDLSIKLES